MEKTAYEIGLYFALRQAGFNKLAEQLKDAGFAEWSRTNLPTFRRWLGLSGQLGHDALTSEGKQILQRTIAGGARARGAQLPTFTARLPAAKSIRATASTAPVQVTPAQLQEKAMREAALKRAREQFQQQQLAIQGGQG